MLCTLPSKGTQCQQSSVVYSAINISQGTQCQWCSVVHFARNQSFVPDLYRHKQHCSVEDASKAQAQQVLNFLALTCHWKVLMYKSNNGYSLQRHYSSIYRFGSAQIVFLHPITCHGLSGRGVQLLRWTLRKHNSFSLWKQCTPLWLSLNTQRRHRLNVSFTAWLSFRQTPRWLFHLVLALTHIQRRHHLKVSFTAWLSFRQTPRWFPLSCRRSRQTPGMTRPLRTPPAFQTCKQNHQQSHFHTHSPVTLKQ